MSRDPNISQARGLPGWELRKQNTLGPAFEVFTLFKSADLPVTEGADWGPPIRVLGYDRIALLAAYIDTATHTGFVIAAQAGETNNPSAESWYDLYDDRATPGTLARRTWALAGLSADAFAAWEIPTTGAFMRFKGWGSGTFSAGGRLALSARLLMDSP